MTPIEKLIAEHLEAFREACWYANAEYERKAHAEIHAMTVARQRGLGQIARHVARRLRANFQGGTR